VFIFAFYTRLGYLNRHFYSAFNQSSDPVNWTDTSERNSRSGLPSAVPW